MFDSHRSVRFVCAATVLILGFGCACATEPSIEDAGLEARDSGVSDDAGSDTDADAGESDSGKSDSGVEDSGVPDDAGVEELDAGEPDAGAADAGCVPSGPCEKNLGVCAGKVHECVNGAPEPICTSASYGPDYASDDLLCDGLDNDCDGLIDVTTPVLLRSSLGFRYVSWMGAPVFRTDAGFVAFLYTGEPMVLDPAGRPLAAPPWTHATRFLSTDEAVVLKTSDGFRVPYSAGSDLYVVDYGPDGRPLYARDGGLLTSWVGSADASVGPLDAVLTPDGGTLYAVLADQPPFFGRVLLMLREADGGAAIADVTHSTTAYRAQAKLHADGSFVLVQNHHHSDGGHGFGLSTWTSDLQLISDGQFETGRALSAGWVRWAGKQVVLVERTSGSSGLQTWDPEDPDAGLVDWWSPGPHAQAFAAAEGDEPLAVGVFVDPTVDAGPESLVAITGDGGARILANWTGAWSYHRPHATIIDSHRALVVFGYPGPQDAGYYSLQFCR